MNSWPCPIIAGLSPDKRVAAPCVQLLPTRPYWAEVKARLVGAFPSSIPMELVIALFPGGQRTLSAPACQRALEAGHETGLPAPYVRPEKWRGDLERDNIGE